jgi:hypothetical protein
MNFSVRAGEIGVGEQEQIMVSVYQLDAVAGTYQFYINSEYQTSVSLLQKAQFIQVY